MTLVQTFVLCSVVTQASSTSIPFTELLPHSRPLRMSPQCQPQSYAWVWGLNPTFQHPSLVCSSGRASQAGWAGQGSGPRVQVSLSGCHTRVAMFSPTENEALLLSKLNPRRGASPDVQTAPHFHVPPPPRVQAPSHFLSSSFCFFFLLSYLAQQECICPCRFPRASASGQLGSVRSVPFLCILHVFVERDPLASWSFCLCFISKLLKGSSIFSKSLRIFPEQVGKITCYLISSSYLSLRHQDLMPKKPKIEDLFPEANLGIYERFHLRNFNKTLGIYKGI